jgi:RNA polymerase sigma factor (sigma-70 family)
MNVLEQSRSVVESHQANGQTIHSDEQTMPDSSLIDGLIAGNEQSLGMVYDRYVALVYGLAKSVSRDEQIARDVTQMVFIHLWEFPHRVDLSRGSLKSYLGVLTHRRAVDAVRRSEQHIRTAERFQFEIEPTSPSSDVDVLHSSAGRWQRDRLKGFINGLPTDQQEALRLAYFGGRTYREVAVELGIPEGTAKSRLRRALAQLREQLDNDDRWAWT